jgi:hypothetical protein
MKGWRGKGVKVKVGLVSRFKVRTEPRRQSRVCSAFIRISSCLCPYAPQIKVLAPASPRQLETESECLHRYLASTSSRFVILCFKLTAFCLLLLYWWLGQRAVSLRITVLAYDTLFHSILLRFPWLYWWRNMDRFLSKLDWQATRLRLFASITQPEARTLFLSRCLFLPAQLT